MKSIIEQMYDGDLFPTGTYEHSSMEYKIAMDKLVASESELLAFRIGARIALEIIGSM